jgi:hypothetical protein
MAHLGFIGEVEQVRVDLVLAERADRKRRHEVRAGLGEDGARLHARLRQQADKFEALISSDAAANDEQHAFVAHAAGSWVWSLHGS